jgi:hypothetical protein
VSREGRKSEGRSLRFSFAEASECKEAKKRFAPLHFASFASAKRRSGIAENAKRRRSKKAAAKRKRSLNIEIKLNIKLKSLSQS